MKSKITEISGAINKPKGFLASGVSCGIKKNNLPDLALIVSENDSKACGVFTKNIVKGHSLQRTMNTIKSGICRAVVINSGNANACVGQKGYDDAQKMARFVADKLNISPDKVLTGSTGVIGQNLPMDKIESGVEKAISALDCSEQSGHDSQYAIMTTDTKTKEKCLLIDINGHDVYIAGMAKGSGMIHPDMATMISIITTDCNISGDLLNHSLHKVINKSFNRISVDGDTSVCDMVILLANCKAENPEITSTLSPEYFIFEEALEILCIDLAKKIAQDGEGATKLVEINVLNAKNENDAYLILQSVSKSPLVKTAMFGEDANWGRIITAMGYSGAKFDPEICDIYIGDLNVCKNGSAVNFDETLAKAILQKPEINLSIDLKQGEIKDTMWTSDFSYEYVKINGSYRS